MDLYRIEKEKNSVQEETSDVFLILFLRQLIVHDRNIDREKERNTEREREREREKQIDRV